MARGSFWPIGPQRASLAPNFWPNFHSPSPCWFGHGTLIKFIRLRNIVDVQSGNLAELVVSQMGLTIWQAEHMELDESRTSEIRRETVIDRLTDRSISIHLYIYICIYLSIYPSDYLPLSSLSYEPLDNNGSDTECNRMIDQVWLHEKQAIENAGQRIKRINHFTTKLI